MAVRLTDETVAEMRCPEGRKDALAFDADLPGFGVRIASNGKKLFLFQYNTAGGKRRVTLGTFGTELTTAKARKKAEILRGQARDGRDPVGERRKAEAQAAAAAASAAYTVDVLIQQWTEHHLSARSASYQTRVPRDLRAAMGKWLKVPAATMTRADAVHVLDAVKIDSGPVQANRIRAVARACWTWAMKRGALDTNPWSATPRPLAREVPRERVLTDAEVGVLYTAAGALAEPWHVLVRVLILTGQRRGEVAGMRWDELDLDAAVWRLPGDRTKNHQPQTVPLAAEAVKMLRTVKRRHGAVYVFEGPRNTAVSGFGKVKARLDAALVKAAKEEAEATKRPARKIEPWVIHDIRRTVATGLQRLGVRLEVTEAVLNHVSGSRKGIVGVYQRHGWEAEKKAALDAWAAHVLAAAEGKQAAGNVVELRREAVA